MDRIRRADVAASLNLNLLRTFVRVVEIGSITRAARSLYLAQSAVSGQVTALSAYAGGPLLERRDGQLVPTGLGRAMYEGAQEVLASVAQLGRRLQGASDETVHAVAIACTRIVCETTVARIVSRFAGVHPDVRLVISGGTRKDAEARLRAGEIDVALVEGPAEVSGMRLLPFHLDRLFLAVPAGHELAARRSVPFKEAAPYPFVMRTPESGTRLLIEQRLGARFERVAVALELEGNQEIVSCVEAGIGLAILSETVLAGARALGTVAALEISDVDLSRAFFVAVPQRSLSHPAALFAEWLTTGYSDGGRTVTDRISA